MSIQAGLVGLPNVGKSTLFNALTKSTVPAENYPFCTIDPHVAITQVPDSRMDKLLKLYNSQKKIPSSVTFVDIAGLVKGAASGEGLGNQFLNNIREVDLILHVLRCFEDPNIIYSGKEIDPINDYEIIISELMLKDLESVNHRQEKLTKLIKATASDPKKQKEMTNEFDLLDKVKKALDNMQHEEVQKLIKNSEIQTVPLLAAKNSIIIANISENEIENYQDNKYYQDLVNKFGSEKVIPICVKVEYELSQLNNEEAQEIMNLLNMKEKGIDRIITQTYKNLGLITFFTCGPKEIHAWPIRQGTTIRKAAGEIHSDLERGFICAELFNCQELFEYGSITKLKEVGKLKTVGQDYIVQDGDIITVRFNV